jgi:hypothetical protein
MKPGDTLKDPLFNLQTCAVLNDLNVMITLPSFVIDQVKSNSDVTPEWPLGIYVVFVGDGVLLGIHGRTPDGELVDKNSTLELTEDEVPEIGEDIWNLWKLLRNTPDEVVEANYQNLLGQTHAQDS